jgi:uncharacterized membrane protein YozB (DUF420 family)
VERTAVVLTVVLGPQGLVDFVIVIISSMTLVCCSIAFWFLGLGSFLVIRGSTALGIRYTALWMNLLAALD